jgi:hypothetical protein
MRSDLCSILPTIHAPILLRQTTARPLRKRDRPRAGERPAYNRIGASRCVPAGKIPTIEINGASANPMRWPDGSFSIVARSSARLEDTVSRTERRQGQLLRISKRLTSPLMLVTLSAPQRPDTEEQIREMKPLGVVQTRDGSASRTMRPSAPCAAFEQYFEGCGGPHSKSLARPSTAGDGVP